MPYLFVLFFEKVIRVFFRIKMRKIAIVRMAFVCVSSL